MKQINHQISIFLDFEMSKTEMSNLEENYQYQLEDEKSTALKLSEENTTLTNVSLWLN